MKTLEYRHNDFNSPKKTWGKGPWESEPDKAQWQDEKTGLPCLVVRNRFGAWCGYVGVSQEHPAFGRDYDDIHVDVHGGLTFASTCQEHEPGAAGEAAAICHVVEDGEDDNVWWLGFDCGHAFDYSPAMGAHVRELHEKSGEAEGLGLWWDEPYDHARAVGINRHDPLRMMDTYRTLGYVKSEVRRLAEQLAAMKGGRNEHVG